MSARSYYYFVRGLYFLSVVAGILFYARGYDLYFEYGQLSKSFKQFLIPNLTWFVAIRYAIVVSFVFSAFGWGGRWLMTIGWVLFSVYQYQIDPQLLPYTTNLTFFVLGAFVLCEPMLKSGDADGVLRGQSYGFLFIKAMLSAQYLSAAITKLSVAGVDWTTGARLQNYFYENYLYTGSELARLMSESEGISSFLAIIVLLFEGLFWLVLIFPKQQGWFALVGLLFHFLVYQVMHINFFWFFVPAYVVFIPYEWSVALEERSRAVCSFVAKIVSIRNPGRSKKYQ